MERLKALLYCLRCHIILLIFIGFAASGYVLRHDLAQYLEGVTGTDRPESVRPLRAEAQIGRTLVPTPATAPTGGFPLQSAGPREMAPQQPAVDDHLHQGDFLFRPITPTTTDAGLDRRMLVNEARRAYWNGDIRQAVSAYQRLLDAFPGQPDYLGELGNIYYAQGARGLAASFYLEAAEVLLSRGERSRSEKLAEILEELDPERGAKLRRRLEVAGYWEE